MASPSNDSPLLPHGGYRKLRSYKVAQVVYDATIVFCRRFLSNDRRTTDQMVQAARSGVRNISEASGAAATSRKTEMKLTNVARASLSDELLPDYESYLRQNGLPIWPKESRKARAMRQRLAKDDIPCTSSEAGGKVVLNGLDHLPAFIARTTPEIAANALICAINQAAYLLRRQLDAQAKAFTSEGGFTENLYNTRAQARSKSDRSDTSDWSDVSDSKTPSCPACGQAMIRRTARQGTKAGQAFWGCNAYPKCRGTRPVIESAEETR